jgi:hypothetical protein
VSLDVNRAGLLALLDAGVSVRYFDHHFAGDIPAHPNLDAHIDLDAKVCTSIIVDRYLEGRFRPWAAVGAFGDSLREQGRALAAAEMPIDEQARTDVRGRVDVRLEAVALGKLSREVVVEIAHRSARFEELHEPRAVHVERNVEHDALVAGFRGDALEQVDVALHARDELARA